MDLVLEGLFWGLVFGGVAALADRVLRRRTRRTHPRLVTAFMVGGFVLGILAGLVA